MSGHEDAEDTHRHKAPYTARHPIPTIQNFRREKDARRAEASEAGGNGEVEPSPQSTRSHSPLRARETEDQQQNAGAPRDGSSSGPNDDDTFQPALDTSQLDSSTSDPKARRKELKKRKDERAEREVTDPVTHLSVKIHDLTSAALDEVPENDPPFGTTGETATGVSNKTKSAQQLHEEAERLQSEHDSLQSLFPPPSFDAVKEELVHTYQRGVTVALVGIALVAALLVGMERSLTTRILDDQQRPRTSVAFAIWGWPPIISLCTIWAIIAGVRDWTAKRIRQIWDDEVWAAKPKTTNLYNAETVAWLNSIVGSVWPLINPDLFTSLADTLEDVMQASLPRVVQMVSVNDLGQGSEGIRILGIRWLPTGAAARSVTEDGKLQDAGHDDHSNDRKVSGQGQVESSSQEKSQQGDDGSQQQIAEGLEAEEGDFVNIEVAFAYRARSKKRSLKDRARDMHLYIAFYLPGNVKVPVWVDLRGVVGTMRLRLQLCPDPPFFSLCTLTFLGQPKVDISCTPLSKHAVNIMDVPFLSNFVQSAVDAAMAEYVAPKSLNLDLKDMLAGDDFKKDTNTRGILVVHVKRGYEFKKGDVGIPMLRDGSSDPYVSVGWAKFGKPVWSTRLLLKEMEPWWDETAYILVTPEELNVSERLRIQLWDADRFTADDDLGRIEVDLKELMTRADGQMWTRSDGFRALEGKETLPGKLEWSVGYFSKTRIQDDQLQRQTFNTSIRTMDQLKEEVNRISERKLREANTKEGRHKRDADELHQQRAQELKAQQDAMIISSPPPDGYPSGILSIQIHQITGLELEKVSKTQQDRAAEGDDEAEEGEDLPSAYCTIIINHSKVFKTRTKPKNAKPFYNAGTERFIADWRTAEVYVAVRDGRVKEDDVLLGIVHLPLGEVFKERAQVNGFYPLAGGVGFGRIRVSMVWRSVQLQAPAEAIGWDRGTVEVQPSVSGDDLPKDLQKLKLKLYTDLGSGKMYPSHDEGGWHSKNQKALKLPVRKRYGSCLAIQFRQHKTLGDKTAAFAILWLKEIPDKDGQEVILPVWKGDFERARKNALPEHSEKLGSISVRVTFWSGLGAAHSKWASKDPNVREVAEVLETARGTDEELANEKKVGIVDGHASDSSASGEGSDDEGEDEETSDGEKSNGPLQWAHDFKKHQGELNKRNRGLMQWKIPRTAQWAARKVENAEGKVGELFKHHTRGAGVETEV